MSAFANVRPIVLAPRLAPKPCGSTQCPNDMKSLWAAAHLAVVRWEEYLHHPTDPDLRDTVKHHMEVLRAAAKLAEPVMEVRLAPTPAPEAA